MMPDPSPGTECRVFLHHADRVYPNVPCVVLGHKTVGDRLPVKLLATVCPGWEAGDTYRATIAQLHPKAA